MTQLPKSELIQPVIISFRADDAGLCNAANAGILDCIHSGLLRNVSLMTIPVGFSEAAEMLGKHPEVEVGLHVTLTCEWAGVNWKTLLPQERVSSLVDADGHLYPDATALLANEPEEEEFIAEMAAQLARARAAGLKVRYLDEHMAIGYCLGFRDAVRRFAEAEGLIYADDLPFAKGLLDDEVDPARFIEKLATYRGDPAIQVLHPSRVPVNGEHYVLSGRPDSSIASRRNAERLLIMDPRLASAYDTGQLVSVSISELHSGFAPLAQGDFTRVVSPEKL
jgi:predicted glycoside hydrolase/deacetylase ChbG (UPF0249 family)